MKEDTSTAEHLLDNECCPVFQHAVELIGRRWTGAVLSVLGSGSLRFGEIRARIPGISDRLLVARLTELEGEHIVVRTEADGEVRYAATPKGVALQPVLDSLADWAAKHSDCS